MGIQTYMYGRQEIFSCFTSSGLVEKEDFSTFVL